MFTAHKVRPLLLVATPLLVILAVLVLYYLSYVRDRERYFAERYLRALSVLSEQTEGALEGLRSAFDNATYESRRAVDGNKPTQLSPKDQLKVVKVVQDQLALIPDFDISPQTKKETKKGHQCRDETEIIVGPHSVEPRQTTTRHNRGHLSSTKLLFCFSAQEVGSVTLANLLERLIADSPLGDVDVFVIDGSGRLLFRRGTTGLQFVGFPSHAKRPNAGGDPAPHNSTEHLPVVENLQHSAFISKVVLSETTYTLFTQPLRMDMRDSKKTADSSGDSSATWVVGALIPSHRLTRDTRAISLAAMSVLPLLFLFALLSLPALKIWRMNARERLRAVDIYLLGISIVVITALAVMLLLAWYEYGSLSRDLDTEMREVSHRLRRNFAEEMGAAHMVLKRFIEVRTGSLPLRESAGEDTGPSRDGLLCTRIWSKSGKCISRKSQDGPAKSPVKMPLTKRGQKAAQTASQRPLAPPSDISQAWKEYPYFEMLVLADADGRQREKWTVRNTTTPLINISTHSSFLDPHEGRLWFGPFPDDRFALNVVASPNTGETLVILSVGAPYSEPSGIRKVGIASMVLDPISLLEPVLAPGMGFAVIESDGPVLFHSNQQRRLYENFYAEIDNSHALRSAVLARRAAGMNVVYHGRPHRFYVAPIKDTPWSLLIFRDRELLRALNVEMVATAVVLFALYITCVVVMLTLAGLCFVHDHSAFLWPQRDHPAGDFLSFLLACLSFLSRDLLFACLLAVLWAAFYGWSVWTLIVLLPVCLAFVFRVLSRWSYCTLECAQVVYGLSLALVVGVVPVVVFYHDAFAQGMETFTRLQQMKLAAAWATRAERVRSRYWDPAPAGADQNKFEERWRQRLDKSWDLSLSEQLSVSVSSVPSDLNVGASKEQPPPSQPRGWLLGWILADLCAEPGSQSPDTSGGEPAIDDPLLVDLCRVMQRHVTGFVPVFLPVYNQEAIELRQMISEQAKDERWQWWKPESEGRATLELRDPRLAVRSPGQGGGSVAVQAYVPGLELPHGTVAPILWLLAVGAGLLCGFVGLRRLARRIFGVQVVDDEPPHGEDKEQAKGRLWLDPKRSKVEGLKEDSRAVIDFQEMATPSECSDRLSTIGPSESYLLDRFEDRLDDPAWNRAKLELVEELLLRRETKAPKETDVIIVSEIDLLSYFGRRLKSAGNPADPSPPTTPLEMERWATVLSGVRKVRHADSPADAGRTEPSLALEDVLDEECQWTPRLRGIRDEIRDEIRQGQPWDRLTKEQLIHYIGDLAEAHYYTLWGLCTDEERLTLIHLAQEGFVNPHNWAVVNRLMEQHVIKRGPPLRVMNESFRQFVLRAEEPATVRQWEKAQGLSTWGGARNIVITVLVAVGAFVFLTQPEAITKWPAFLTGLVAGVSALLQLFNIVQNGGKAASAGNGSQ